ncbi:MAG TPA: hypothetical protein VD994_13180, partial [Prosthecobacter sp.]|nr:hypothetical protein [Prosthecobacter sp.]
MEKAKSVSFSWVIFTHRKSADVLSFGSRRDSKFKAYPRADMSPEWMSASQSFPLGHPLSMGQPQDSKANGSPLRCQL